jgi:hypothetical protein
MIELHDALADQRFQLAAGHITQNQAKALLGNLRDFLAFVYERKGCRVHTKP